MIGSVVNALCIVLAAIAVAAGVPAISGRVQRRLQTALGVGALALGFHVVWNALGPTMGGAFKGLAIALLALSLGRVTGSLLRLQETLNRCGRFAGEVLTPGPDRGHPAPGDLFRAGSVIFCLTPLAVLGPLLDGWASDMRVLLLKSLVDGIATFGLVRARGPAVAIAAVPVLAVQGTLAIGFAALAPIAEVHRLAGPTLITAGLVLVFVSLVMFQAVRIRLADYLAALPWAALLAWLLN